MGLENQRVDRRKDGESRLEIQPEVKNLLSLRTYKGVQNLF